MKILVIMVTIALSAISNTGNACTAFEAEQIVVDLIGKNYGLIQELKTGVSEDSLSQSYEIYTSFKIANNLKLIAEKKVEIVGFTKIRMQDCGIQWLTSSPVHLRSFLEFPINSVK